MTDNDALKSRLRGIMESIDTNAGTAHPQTQPNLTEGQHLVIGLLAVCRNNFRGVYFLLRDDHSEQARIIGRTLLTDCLRLWYLLDNRDRLELLKIAFDLASIYQERKLVDELCKHTGDSEEADAALTLLDTQEKELQDAAAALGCDESELKREVAVFHNTERLFEISPAPEGYFVFRHASHVVHTTRVALEAAKLYRDDGSIALNFGGSPGNVLRVGIQASKVFLVGHTAAAEMLGWETLHAVESFHQHASGQLDKLTEDAGIGGIENFLSEQKVEQV